MVIGGRGCQVAGTLVCHARGGPWAYGVDGNGTLSLVSDCTTALAWYTGFPRVGDVCHAEI